jgi:hypothetical protein
VKRTYIAGTDALDPQYSELPSDLTEADRRRYFDPIVVTDANGELAPWVRAASSARGGSAAERQMEPSHEPL